MSLNNSSGLWTTTNTLSSGSSISTSITGSSNQFTIQSAKTKYHVLGEEVEVEGYKDASLTIILCNITIMGEPYYNELKKNGFVFGQELEDLFKRKFRDNKIDQILKD